MRVKEVRPQPNWILSITTDNGRLGTFDVGPYLEYEAFADLRGPTEFMKVSNGGYFIEWECGADLSADTIEANWRVIFRSEGDGESGEVMDEDLDRMTREELIEEAKKLRQGIRRHRDSSRHELCWHHPALWGLLPEKTDPIPVVPEWPQFMRGCVKYRQSLDEQAPNAPRTNEPHGT